MAPPQQCLDPHRAPGGQLDDGLVLDEELALVQGGGKLGLQAEPVDVRLAEARLEEGVVVASGVLGGVEGDVGVLQELLAVVVLLGRHGDAHAHLDEKVASGKGERHAHRRAHAGGHGGDLVDAGGVVQEDGELVSPEAGDGVARAYARAEALGGRDENLVSARVAEGVVHVLEAVEVAEQHGDAASGGRPPGQGVLDTVAEQARGSAGL